MLPISNSRAPSGAADATSGKERPGQNKYDHQHLSLPIHIHNAPSQSYASSFYTYADADPHATSQSSLLASQKLAPEPADSLLPSNHSIQPKALQGTQSSLSASVYKSPPPHIPSLKPPSSWLSDVRMSTGSPLYIDRSQYYDIAPEIESNSAELETLKYSTESRPRVLPSSCCRYSFSKGVGVFALVCSLLLITSFTMPHRAWSDYALNFEQRLSVQSVVLHPTVSFKVGLAPADWVRHHANQTAEARNISLIPTTPVSAVNPTPSSSAAPTSSEAAANMAADAVSGRDVVLRRFRRWTPPSPSSTSATEDFQALEDKEFNNLGNPDPVTQPGLAQYVNCIKQANSRNSLSNSSSSLLSGPRVAVVTSVAPAPTLAMLQLVQLQQHWCVLVIGDLKSPDYAGYQSNVEWMLGAQQSTESMSSSNASAAERRFLKHVELQATLLDKFSVGWGLKENTELQRLTSERLAYLSADEQKLIHADVVRITPFRSFARKNIGYLLAAWSGAGIIFDVDDDNMYLPRSSTVGLRDLPYFPGAREFGLPQSGQLQQHRQNERQTYQYVDSRKGLFNRTKKVTGVEYDSAAKEFQRGPSLLPAGAAFTVSNPYPHFGLQSGWPRGFPLDMIGPSLKATPKRPLPSVSEASHICYPMVQQYLANVDPDVDAIWRMSSLEFEQGEGKGPLRRLAADEAERKLMAHQTFFMPFSAAVKESSLAVPPAAATPYNAQATIHLPAAYFAMLLPMTVHGRVADIWRSYFTQTLMSYLEFHTTQEEQLSTSHDSVGAATNTSSSSFGVRVPGCLVFHPAYIAHFRNPHSFHADYMSEQPLYAQTPALLDFLQQRRKGQKHDLLTRVRRRNVKAQSSSRSNAGSSNYQPSWPESESFLLAEDIASLQELLWMDLYEVGILEIQDVQYVKAWNKALRKGRLLFSTTAETPIQQPLLTDASNNDGPSEDQLLQTPARIRPPIFPSLLPSGQSRVGVCVVFNFPCSPEALMRVVRKLQYQHVHLTFMNPLPFEQTSAEVQAIFEAHPQFGYIYAQVMKGLHQMYSITQCTEWYHSLLLTDNGNSTSTDDPSKLQVDGVMDSQFLMSDEGKISSPAFPLSAPSAPLHGIFYTSDDLFFNITKAMLPPPHGSAFQIDRHWVMQNQYELNATSCLVTKSWPWLKTAAQSNQLCETVRAAPWQHLLDPYFPNKIPYCALADLVYLTAHRNALDRFVDLIYHLDARVPHMRSLINEAFIAWAVLLAQSKANADAGQDVQKQHSDDIYRDLGVGRIEWRGALWSKKRDDINLIKDLVLTREVPFVHPLKLSGFSPLPDFTTPIPTSDSNSIQPQQVHPENKLFPIFLHAKFESMQLSRWDAAEKRQWKKVQENDDSVGPKLKA